MKKRRTQSEKELLKRRYHSDVRKLKKLCEECDIKLYTYNNAPEDAVCVLSSSEYELGELRKTCSIEYENYFVSLLDYESFPGI